MAAFTTSGWSLVWIAVNLQFSKHSSLCVLKRSSKRSLALKIEFQRLTTWCPVWRHPPILPFILFPFLLLSSVVRVVFRCQKILVAVRVLDLLRQTRKLPTHVDGQTELLASVLVLEVTAYVLYAVLKARRKEMRQRERLECYSAIRHCCHGHQHRYNFIITTIISPSQRSLPAT